MLRQFTHFGIVGVGATIVHVTVGLTLNNAFGVVPLWANLVGFSCGVGTSFFGNTRLTFPYSNLYRGAFLRFASVAITGLALNQAMVWIVTSAFHGPYWLALAIIVSTVPGLTFVLLKFWALRS